ncbi:hypothetical protein [Nakamurella sp.]|uniref:hypothetical protein n=1 Tax=Nakamurella sp. TaxID=1869182 RepID=UPI003783CB0A
MRCRTPFGAYEAIEQQLNPRLKAVMDTDEFARALSIAHTWRDVVGRAVGSVNVRLLHAVSMPSNSDVTRLSRHIGELDREVRMLRHELTHRDGGSHVS